jgi:hypothetical protein
VFPISHVRENAFQENINYELCVGNVHAYISGMSWDCGQSGSVSNLTLLSSFLKMERPCYYESGTNLANSYCSIDIKNIVAFNYLMQGLIFH